MLPVEAQPFHRVDNGIDVFLIFLFRIGVIEAQVAAAVVVARQTKIDVDRFGMADVQIAVGLGWKTRHDLRQQLALAVIAVAIGTGNQIGFDDAAQEIGRRGGGVTVFQFVAHG